MSPIALYYPWRHFQLDFWVLEALLTWDRVARLRPAGLRDVDSECIRQIREETDFILDITPSPADLATVTAAFTDLVDAQGVPLAEWFPPLGGLDDARFRPPFSQNLHGGGVPYFDLYAGPPTPLISRELGELLVEYRVGVAHRARSGEHQESSWIRVPNRLGSIYLAALADVVAAGNRLALTTDDPRMHRASGALDRLPDLLRGMPLPGPAVEDPTNAYVHLALRAAVDFEGQRPSPTTLIRFRERHRDQLAVFHQHVAALGEELQAVASVEDITVAHAHLESLYRSTTKPQLDELRRTLRGAGIETSTQALTLKVDVNAAAGTLLGGVAAVGGQVTLAGAAVAVTVLPYLASKFKARRDAIASSPVSYLLAASRMPSGQNLAEALRGWSRGRGGL
ncbi:DUF6236 family protein [Streptomyces canus]|uniref:DUF6236 family protein n=1 Tax=Streptomyces canus TaxID=58343 RepID=UPI00225C1FBE|nr:DUF6236 family protein [Streptomyces canus]MCX4862411.1 DUF6236 family protein [Streptomyces canus]